MIELGEHFFYLGPALAVLLIAVGWYGLRRRKNYLAEFSRMPGAVMGNRSRVLASACTLVAVLLLCLALSEAAREESGDPPATPGIDWALVLDLSRSMYAEENGTTRLQRAIDEVEKWLPLAHGDRVGVVGFAGSRAGVCPLTHDLGSLPTFLDRVKFNRELEGGSCLGLGLFMGEWMLEEETHRPRSVVLISDGEDRPFQPNSSAWTGSTVRISEDKYNTDPVLQAADLKKKGIRVSCLVVGSPAGAKIPRIWEGFLTNAAGEEVVSRSDPALMRKIAEAGGGACVAGFETPSPMEVLYRKITRMEHPVAKSRTSLYPTLVLIALILLLLPSLRLPNGRAGLPAVALLFLAAAPGGGEEGLERFRAGDFFEARDCFEEALQERGEDPDLLVNLGLSHWKSGSPEKALSAFEQVLALGPSSADAAARFASGLVHLEQGAFDRAGSCFIACLKRNAWPEEAAVNLALANARKQAEQEAAQQSGTGEPTAGGGGTGQSEGTVSTEAGVQSVEAAEAGNSATGTVPSLAGRVVRLLTAEEKQEIFDRLEKLRQQQHDLEREALEALLGQTWSNW